MSVEAEPTKRVAWLPRPGPLVIAASSSELLKFADALGIYLSRRLDSSLLQDVVTSPLGVARSLSKLVPAKHIWMADDVVTKCHKGSDGSGPLVAMGTPLLVGGFLFRIEGDGADKVALRYEREHVLLRFTEEPEILLSNLDSLATIEVFVLARLVEMQQPPVLRVAGVLLREIREAPQA